MTQNRYSSTFWTPDRINMLVKLHRSGKHTCLEIAARIGDGCTKNMVIGKIHRMREFERLHPKTWRYSDVGGLA